MNVQKTLVTAELLPGLSSRLSSEGKRTELVEGELVVTAPAGGDMDALPTGPQYSLLTMS